MIKRCLKKIWHSSPAELLTKLSQRLHGVHYVPDDFLTNSEAKRLAVLPRYQAGQTELLGHPLFFIDGPSCLGLCHDIFVEQSLRFACDKIDPFIIDCGSNIGLGLIFFKQLYPQAKILAFEPDPQAFAALQNNISSFSLTNVKCFDQAVWTEAGEAAFAVEGGEGGRLIGDSNFEDVITVKTTRLRDKLDQPVDFLKIDIEGAETEILRDCADRLANVAKLLVEYHSFLDRPQTLSDILTILTAAGFRYCLQEAYVPRHPLVEPFKHGLFDLQLNIAAWRP